MEVALIAPSTLRIKGKQATVFVNPAKQKNTLESDAALFLATPSDFPGSTYTNGLHIFGPGNFEVKGIKISGTKINEQIYFSLMVDGVDMIVGQASFLTKAKDKLQEYPMAVIIADEVLAESTVGVLNSNVIILMGDKAQESAKVLGKEATTVTKYSASKDKLPAETEVILLA